MIKLIDSHAHYDDDAFADDRHELLTHLFETSVEKIVEIGCSMEEAERAVKMTEQYEQLYCAVGVHPEYCENLPSDYIKTLRELAKAPKVVAIGEIGLDYHYENYNREKQIETFCELVELAQEIDKPIIVHSRDATHDCLEVLRKYRPKGVVHCFSGSVETARKILDLGMNISFTGVLTFKNAKKAVASCESIPIERLMLETDCPYMAPVPHRGERCDSSMILHTAEKIAEIKGMTTEDVIRICNANAKKLFGIAD